MVCILSLTLLGGCLKKQATQKAAAPKLIELVYYKLFDQEDIMKPLIQQYISTHPGVTIKYKMFSDQEEYYRTILNELAEGEGPDIFSVPNYWIKKNAKKISALPTNMGSPKDFADTFVSVAEKDLVFTDPRDGETKVFGLPMAIDTLALYYNKGLYEDRVASRGKPAATWDGFMDDVFKLTKADNSFERFEVAGTAIGRSDNISRAMDILYLMMLQYKVAFYNEKLNQAEFAKQTAVGSTSVTYNPAVEALKLYTSFGLASNKNYSWNEYMADPKSDVKEMEAFARGKVATIFGYSYLYEQIKTEIKQLKDQGVATINPDLVKISPVPQVNDPQTSTEKRDAYANYFVETVSRNSENPEAAWEFLMFVTSKDNLTYYNEKTHRPTSRRDLIESQKQDSVYGVFAEQSGFAESILIYDWDLYKQIFSKAIDSVLATTSNASAAIREAEGAINKILPSDGILASPPIIPKGTATTSKSTTTTKTTSTAADAKTSNTDTKASTK